MEFSEQYISRTERHPYLLADKIKDINATSLLLDKELDQQLLEQALALEARIWEREKFNDEGSLNDYRKYFEQSRVFAVFDEGGQCLGISRVFEGRPLLPPFLGLPTYCNFDNSSIKAGCRDGVVEEVATAAVDPRLPYGTASMHMWRLAYRDAVNRGIRCWGIIMEPRRVAAMNRRYGFCFEQIGPEVYYQGGNCAAHILDINRVQTHMVQNRPEAYEWFVNQPLSR